MKRYILKANHIGAIPVLISIFLIFGLSRTGWAAASHKDQNLVVVAFDSPANTLDPMYSLGRAGFVVDWHIFDSFLMRDTKTLRPIPHLVTSWKLVDDLTWELKLRKDVKFHNGEPFNAESVKYTNDRVVDEQNKAPWRSYFYWLKETEIVDEYTVRLHTYKPFPIPDQYLVAAFALPPKYMKSHSKEYVAMNPVGSGPYKFVEWKKGQYLKLVANENWWKKKPAIKHLEFRDIPEAATSIAGLLNGEIDIVRRIPPDQAEVVNKSEIARISNANTMAVVYVGIDQAGRCPESPKALQDVRVRRAIIYAINMDEIIQNIYHGQVLPCPVGPSPYHFGYDGSIKRLPYDLEKARQLMAEAGYSNGFTVSLHNWAGSFDAYDQVSEAIVGYLSKINIKVNIHHWAVAGQYINAARAGKIDGLYLATWVGGGVSDMDSYRQMIHSRSDRSYQKDGMIDKLFEEGMYTLDPEKRKAIYSQLQKRWQELAIWVPGFTQNNMNGVNRGLNYEAAGDLTMPVYDASWK
jgi:peptide/nickel transport system substrate-binding protein